MVFFCSVDQKGFVVFSHFSYSVENSYLEEKEDTCNAVGEIAGNTQWVKELVDTYVNARTRKQVVYV